MTTKTEGAYIRDVLRFEADALYCREKLTVLDGEVISVGEVCKLNSDSKVVACAAAADEVQTITIGGTHTGGSLKLGITLATGAVAWTDTIAWSATEATMTASVNAALDDLLGASEVVCSTIADTAATVLVLTFSGTNYKELPQTPIDVDVSAYTGASTVAVARTTKGHAAGGDATMVALEAASPSGADGSAVMLTRGPAVVDTDQLTVPTGGSAAAVAALKLVGILARSEPTIQQIGLPTS